MAKIIQVQGPAGVQYVALERDDGVRIFADDYAPAQGSFHIVDGFKCWFIRKADFDAALVEAGLQPVFRSRDAA